VLAGASWAQAGTVSLYAFNGGVNINDANPGFASISFSNSAVTGTAHADEYTGGVGAFATATGRHAGMAAQAFASYSTTYTVDCQPAPGELTCGLDFTVVMTGDASAHGNPNSNPNSFGSAEAGYTANWSLSVLRPGGGRLNVAGGGEYHFYFHDSGNTETVVVGTPFTTTQTFYFQPGDEVTLSLKASAGAFTDPSGLFPPDMGSASATANFSNTLRWGGVSGAFSGTGQALDLGAVHLLGADGFDYVQAAALNPYATPVSEPAAAWLMLIGAATMAARNRLRPARP
jgi:hypothetical protein